MTTIAGTGYGYDVVACAGDQPEAQGGWAEEASAYPGCGAWGHFKAPYGIAVGASPSDVFITDTLAYAVRKVTTALAPSVNVSRAAFTLAAANASVTAGQVFNVSVTVQLYDAFNGSIHDAARLRLASAGLHVASNTSLGMLGLGACTVGSPAGTAVCSLKATLAPSAPRLDVLYTSPFATDPASSRAVGSVLLSVVPGNVSSAVFALSSGPTDLVAGQNITVSATARLYDIYNNSITEPSALRQAAAAVSVTVTTHLGTLLGLGACTPGPTDGSASCDIFPTLAPSTPRLDVVFTSPFPTYAASSLVIGSFSLAVAPGDPSAANFLLAVFSPDYLLPAPASFEVFVGLRDSFGNLIATGDYAAALPLVSVGATLPGGASVNATCVGNATSVSATCRLRLTVASPSLQAPYSVRAFYKGAALGAGPFALVVIPGDAYPPYFSISPGPATVIGGNFTLGVRLADAFNNSLLFGQVGTSAFNDSGAHSAPLYQLLSVELRRASGGSVGSNNFSCLPSAGPSVACLVSFSPSAMDVYTARVVFNGSVVPVANNPYAFEVVTSMTRLLSSLALAPVSAAWSAQAGWASGVDVCSYRGVGCDAAGTIMSLNLTGVALRSTIPSGIAQLSTLTALLLPKTELFGTVPAAMGALTNLRALWLQDNAFSGSLPSTLSSLTALTDLLLQGNKGMSGAIPDFSRLPNLQRVWLTTHDASASPDQCHVA